MQKVLIATRLDKETIEELKKIADKKERTISDLIRIIIKQYIQQQNI